MLCTNKVYKSYKCKNLYRGYIWEHNNLTISVKNASTCICAITIKRIIFKIEK